MLILISDPDFAHVYRLETSLRSVLGEINVVKANSLASTLSSIESADLLFLELSLSDSMGIQTIISIRKKNPNIPIIVMMAIANATLKKEIQAAGANAFFLKSDLDDGLLRKYLSALGFEVKPTSKILRS